MVKIAKKVKLNNQQLIDLFNSGDVEECISACKAIINVDATHAVANNLLGSSFAKTKNFPEAIFYLNYAVKLKPDNPTFLFNLALAQFESDDIDGAIKNYHKALGLNNNLYTVHFNLAKAYRAKGEIAKAIKSYEKSFGSNKAYIKAYLDLGDLFLSQGKLEKAINLFKKAVANNKNSTKALSKLAGCYVKNNQFEEALTIYKKQVNLEPNSAVANHNVGVSLWKLGKTEEAIKYYKHALKLNPKYEDALVHIGVAFMAINDSKNAIRSYKKCIAINGQNTAALFNYANALKALKKWGSSIKYYREVIKINNKHDAAYVNLAVALNAIYQEEEAYGYAKKAIEINPLRKEAFSNIGNYFLNKCALGQALEFYHKATEIDPSYVGALWNESIIHLLKGDFKKGWELYKYRMEKEEFIPVKARMSGKTWNGESISGKTILLHHEQGIGDTFQFIRYAKLLAEEGAVVYVDCPAGIAKTINAVEGVSGTYSKVDEFPKHDYNCPLLDLPNIFKTTLKTIPNKVPYIIAESKYSDKLELDKDRINIGIVWAGNPNHAKDAIRSCDFKLFETLFGANKNAMFYSLQVGSPALDIESSSEIGRYIEDLSDLLTNFSVTASVINRLDLVITVDTSVAHLAGALGKPVWTLLQFSPDWRWMMARSDSPWYPTMRLFRQASNGDWDGLFKDVAKALGSFRKK